MELNNLNIDKLITDVDGVLTDGKFLYSEEGKIFKQFGPHDNDGFKIIKSLGIRVTAVSADCRGFSITKKRLDDMGIEVYLVSEKERLNWVKKHCVLDRTAFVGDGLHDAAVMKVCGLSFAPSNALDITKNVSSYVTKAGGGNGVMLEVGMELLRMFDPARHCKYLEGNTDG